MARASVMSVVPRVSIMLMGFRAGWTDTAMCFMSIQNRDAGAEIRGVEGAVAPMPRW